MNYNKKNWGKLVKQLNRNHKVCYLTLFSYSLTGAITDQKLPRSGPRDMVTTE